MTALCINSGTIFSQDPATASRIPVISYSPVVLRMAGRHVDLQMKVSAPASGVNLPVLLLSHGHGRSNFLSSFHGYGPLADFFASHGFVVIQPTHENSKTLALDPSYSEAPLFWKSRARDMRFIIDNLDKIIRTVPGLKGRVDLSQIAAIGHSLGGHTVAMLAGMEVTDPANGEVINLAEPRLKARVIIGAPGASATLATFAKEHYPVLAGTNFNTMTLPALVVNGDKDKSSNFSDTDNWRADAYHLSPGPKCLLTVFDAGHLFGGVSGYDSVETSDENPERVAFLCNTILAYLHSQLNPKESDWDDVKNNLNGSQGAKGKIDCK
ncbi:chlorophyllase [Chryseolinea soli]|uniref:Chlorophyllase n=2 Tax=Chryseolinea soli TaxID=2321403 RepID=A0A385SNY2_9BACT|nr:chlorophyllase [Chryseolinea soli]